MSLLRDFKAERIIARLLDPRERVGTAEDRKQLVSKLLGLGDTGVNKLIHALGHAARDDVPRISELLVRLLDNASLPVFSEALADGNSQSVSRVTDVLCRGTGFDPNRLMSAFGDPRIPKSALIQVLSVHRKRLDAGALLRYAYTLEPTDRNALMKLVTEVADESLVPELLNRVSGKDPVVRMQIVRILGRFQTPEVVEALQHLLEDPDKGVRQSALEALSAHDARLDLEKLCKLLRDRDIKVQEQAIETIIQRNDPETMKYLSAVLHDEAEHARRAAVEVLNKIGSAAAIKELLESVKDADWWVRARSADALAKIGGPRVVKAVVELIKDDDEFIRRSAIEILNSTRDEQAISHLIDALDDSDWWVRERAVDALANIGNKAATPALVRMLKRDEKAVPVVLRALAKLGDERVIHAVLEQLKRPVPEIQLEALHTLGELAGSENAAGICEVIVKYTDKAASEVREAALEVRDRLQDKFSAAASLTRMVSKPASAHADETLAMSMLQNPDEAARIPAPAPQSLANLDINRLQPGEMIGDRYRYVRRVGRGAFGTVLLVEDEVISESLILKVLHPQMASDEDMIKRFVQEMRLSRKITHENVIRIYDFLNIQGLLAISMEYFPSSTLAVSLEPREPLPVEAALRYAHDIAKGMAAAHETGVVHRDLKPGNVLINNRGVLKIVDFGVAAARAAGDQQLTRTGILIGTPKYMSPEQVLGKPVDARSDIYALGIMMYEMLAGTLPYSGEDQMAVMYQHVQGKARPVSEVNPNVPRTLSAVVAKMMALSPEDRYQNMEEVRRALAGFID
ncbi:HEAT repeat domain-containing protein [Thioalkalivibrio sulfidiphilus]|uniref:HEAT repeat domain-containing protein n=1 Tax=Thioalkalivibrio sulfidiphilus TaxID=1033854 RepID=UPI003B2B3B19